ncbi:unnamed protein product [Spirodela intermedia]|uniref:Uncharacterized protein n=1 Tax=Spirodela intermedia TaxID=51605 RepID=A0A7I8KA85_SPIIN|nr:unnamed protein product [Spirodela intermedia]
MDGAADFAGVSAGGGISGSICLGHRLCGDPPADLSGRVHLLPCVVKHDGPCPVSQYFKPRPTGAASDGLRVEEAFFRGRKLQGASIPLPDGYSGFILSKEGRPGEEEEGGSSSNLWVSRGQFKNLTYWNHDSLPSLDDPLHRCFHWFSVADALHKPIRAVDVASSSSVFPKKT